MEEDGIAYEESMICPITHSVMNDPVVDREGNSYERKAILEWMGQFPNPLSPVTRNPLSEDDLVPNRALKDSIMKRRNEGKNALRPKDINDNDDDIDDISVECSIHSVSDTEVTLLATVVPPAGEAPNPVDVVCVIDISGSMNMDASMKTAEGLTESQGLTQLDIVKHAVRTIMHSLSDRDRVAVVAYASKASTTFGLTKMDEEGRKRTTALLNSLRPQGATALWDGLETACELLKNNPGEGRVRSIMLLTDGMPNIRPPRGELNMLTRYLEKNPDLSFVLNTFGFGYSLLSDLLLELAVAGGGMYAFIPDSSFVGTVFVNAVSNLSSTRSVDISLSFDLKNILSSVKCSSDVDTVLEGKSGRLTVPLQGLQFGQNRDALIRFKPKDGKSSITGGSIETFFEELPVRLTYSESSSNRRIVKELMVRATPANPEKELEHNVQGLRLHAVSVVKAGIKSMKRGRTEETSTKLSSLIDLFEDSSSKDDPRVIALLKDIDGQVMEALSSQYYEKWGAHYLRSLTRAHYMQQCTNFKDPGLQVYRGELFTKLTEKADKIFCSLPAPVPTRDDFSYPFSSSHSSSSSSSSSYGSSPTFSKSSSSSSSGHRGMSAYYDSSAPCFAGHCEVDVIDERGQKSQSRVDRIRKGDRVVTADIGGKVVGSSSVVCVVQTRIASNAHNMVFLPSGLVITPWHPIFHKGEWKFPCYVQSPLPMRISCVYSFILESDHVMMINDVACICLGHSFDSVLDPSSILTGSYFGSKNVVVDLSRMPGFESGCVELSLENIERDGVGKAIQIVDVAVC